MYQLASLISILQYMLYTNVLRNVQSVFSFCCNLIFLKIFIIANKDRYNYIFGRISFRINMYFMIVASAVAALMCSQDNIRTSC